jgi:enamine deaminase RidA (YjgF/YER057c/UK114 family)
MSRWDDYAKAHREILGDVRPASSIVQVAKLVDPRLTIELEMEAVLGCQLVESKSLIFDK